MLRQRERFRESLTVIPLFLQKLDFMAEGPSHPFSPLLRDRARSFRPIAQRGPAMPNLSSVETILPGPPGIKFSSSRPPVPQKQGFLFTRGQVRLGMTEIPTQPLQTRILGHNGDGKAPMTARGLGYPAPDLPAKKWR